MATRVRLVLIVIGLLLAGIDAHFYKCPDKDRSVCTPSKCSAKDANKRALHRCNQWPYWSGGWGSFSEEDEYYTCTNSTDQYCNVWSTQEVKFRKNSTGTCFCIDHELDANGTYLYPLSPNYCSVWICTEFQIFTNCKEDPYTETETCTDLLDTEYNECECSKASTNNEYCAEWSCLQIFEDEIQEIANYSCSDEVTANYCQSWTGDIDSEWEFELLQCECTTADNSSIFCAKWECVEREMTKHFSSGDKYAYFHAIFWPLFIACLIGGSCASGTKNVGVTAVVVFILVSGIGVISGGVGFLAIWGMIFGVPVLFLGCGLVVSKIQEMQFEKQLETDRQENGRKVSIIMTLT